MAPNRLWLIRHAQSAWNATGRWQGQADPPLSELGHLQSALLADRLAKLAPAALYTSDLQRAAQTAAPLAEALNLTPVRRIDLRERDAGAWTGMTYDEIAAAFPEELAAWRLGEDVAHGDGESFVDLTRRVVPFLDELATRHDGEEAIAVTHGGWIRAALAHALGLRLNPPGLGGVANTGISVLRYIPSGLRVLTYNDHAHLDGATP